MISRHADPTTLIITGEATSTLAAFLADFSSHRPSADGDILAAIRNTVVAHAMRRAALARRETLEKSDVEHGIEVTLWSLVTRGSRGLTRQPLPPGEGVPVKRHRAHRGVVFALQHDGQEPTFEELG